MEDRRNKKQLNSKQANRISWLMSAIYFVYIYVKGIMINPIGKQAIYYWLLGCIIGTLIVYALFYFCIFDVEDREKFDEENQMYMDKMKRYIQMLSDDVGMITFTICILLTIIGNNVNLHSLKITFAEISVFAFSVKIGIEVSENEPWIFSILLVLLCILVARY